MIKILLAIGAIALLAGCGNERIVLVPQSQYYATFSVDDFDESKPFFFKGWQESDTNGTYIVSNKKHMLAFIKDAKTDKKEYNTLLRQIKLFNTDIKKMNAIQNNKKPVEVEKYDFK